MTTAFKAVIRLAHHYRRRVAALAYAVASTIALAMAFVIRFELSWPTDQVGLFLRALPWLLLVRTAFAYLFRLTTGRWRFVGVSDVGRLIGAVVAGTGLYWLLSWQLGLLPLLPRSVLLIEAVGTQYLVAGMWISYRLAYERAQHASHFRGKKRRVLVVGAGDAGQMLVREMRRIPVGMVPVGYVDDDQVKWGTRIHGVKVWGKVDQLPRVVARKKVDELLIAVPSAEPTQIRRIVELCEQVDQPFSILPGIAAVLSGEAHLSQVREVRMEDLLGREPVVVELPSVRADVAGGTVLITGAAGSIGSELARQIALHGPSRLLLVDQAETALYYLDLELRGEYPGIEVVPVLMDVADPSPVDRLFQEYHPDRTFHAAAYKHVPMMERHPIEAAKNNIIATWNVATAAGRHSVEKFILVSTDKAVRPANVMGASKRFAELAVLEMQRRHPYTAYGAVRFGNVLGSSGSVIPLFRKQLRQGRPLTITHEDVTRYFMTIPEAVQLIIKASLVPELRGHVAMLEMGEPVRILDMARNLLHLVGTPYKPGENVVFTGLRPGEKLAEDLVGPAERVVPTDVDKVHLVVSDNGLPDGTWLSEFEVLALQQAHAERVLNLLYERFPTVAPAVVHGAPSAAR